MADPVLAVRQKASWALGNILVSFETQERCCGLCDLLSLSDLRAVASALLVGLDDHDKVAVACVRGLGRCVAGLFEACGEIPPDVMGFAGGGGGGGGPPASRPAAPTVAPAAAGEASVGQAPASPGRPSLLAGGGLGSPAALAAAASRSLFSADLDLASTVVKAIARSTLGVGVKVRCLCPGAAACGAFLVPARVRVER
jgi:hypothetical protein